MKETKIFQKRRWEVSEHVSVKIWYKNVWGNKSLPGKHKTKPIGIPITQNDATLSLTDSNNHSIPSKPKNILNGHKETTCRTIR